MERTETLVILSHQEYDDRQARIEFLESENRSLKTALKQVDTYLRGDSE